MYAKRTASSTIHTGSTANPPSRKRISKKGNDSPSVKTEKDDLQRHIQPRIIQFSPTPTLVLETGGSTVKYGLVHPFTSYRPKSLSIDNSSPQDIPSHDVSPLPNTIPNVIARPAHQVGTLVADEIHTVKNKAQLIFTYPLERGYITDISAQFRIWRRVLHKENIACTRNFSVSGSEATFSGSMVGCRSDIKKDGRFTPCTSTFSHSCGILLLHQPFTPRNEIDREDEVWFRDFGFERVARRLGVCCSAYRYLSMLENRQDVDTMEQLKDHNASDPFKVIYPSPFAIDVNVKDAYQAEYVFSSSEKHQTNGVKNDGTGCCCIVDSGFSLTHVVPTKHGNAIVSAIRRINIGGKLLTNLLKETVSYRQWNMRDEYFIINEVKEKVCFVTTDFDKKITYARYTKEGQRCFDRDFVLPDFVNTSNGSVRLPLALQSEKELNDVVNLASYKFHDTKKVKNPLKGARGDCINRHIDESKVVKKKCIVPGEILEGKIEKNLRQRDGKKEKKTEEQERQVLKLSVERFSIPEVLFRPSDIGLNQVGIAEAIVQSISACNPIYHAAMYNNIVLTGGTFNIPNLAQRLEMELRSLTPSNYTVRIHMPKDVMNYAWKGAHDLAQCQHFFKNEFINKIEWETHRKNGKGAGEIWMSL